LRIVLWLELNSRETGAQLHQPKNGS